MNKKIEEIIRGKVSDILEEYIGDFNDNVTRKTITSQVDEFLESIAEEIYDYEIVCNDTNNPAKMIDEGRLTLEIYIQYQNGEEYKKYRCELYSKGVEFSEFNKTEEVDG